VDRFIEHFNQVRPGGVRGISPEALAALMAYDWPGNVRELKNAIEQAVVLCPADRIELHHLPEQVLPESNRGLPAVGLTLREIEKRAIELALQRNGNRPVATARELGIDKNTLRRKIKRLGITVAA
jgi:DNA-binding NtrC family response regulator